MVTVICPRCQGTGESPLGDPCQRCGGDGKIEGSHSDQVEALILDLHNILYGENIFPSYKILEAIDATEYNALTAAKKDGVKMLLSCGCVDLNEGKAGRVRLLGWFGAESTTVANLTELLS